jgi:hypothetical protein
MPSIVKWQTPVHLWACHKSFHTFSYQGLKLHNRYSLIWLLMCTWLRASRNTLMKLDNINGRGNWIFEIHIWPCLLASSVQLHHIPYHTIHRVVQCAKSVEIAMNLLRLAIILSSKLQNNMHWSSKTLHHIHSKSGSRTWSESHLEFPHAGIPTHTGIAHMNKFNFASAIIRIFQFSSIEMQSPFLAP